VGVQEIRRVIADAQRRLEDDERRTILFLDEIHRFARNQQDVLLGSVEDGVITLIGATTENPFFAVNSALNSRSTMFRFEPLTDEQIGALVRRAARDERGFGRLDVRLDDAAVAHWARRSDGDARRALNALEVAVLSHVRESADATTVHIDLACAEASIQAKALVHDATGDEHYDLVSAFIKSMRGGDPDAAVYWLARMLEAGEDPRFVARRIAILASEDIGNADPQALSVAAAAWTVTERVGMPECQLTLAQAAIYMAMAPKSDASARAVWDAAKDVREGRTVAVPKALRDASYRGAEHLGHGAGYVSPHRSGADRPATECFGVERTYYRPTNRGFEDLLRRRLEEQRERSEEEESRGEVSDEGEHERRA
jgi:putative ATPase